MIDQCEKQIKELQGFKVAYFYLDSSHGRKNKSQNQK